MSSSSVVPVRPSRRCASGHRACARSVEWGFVLPIRPVPAGPVSAAVSKSFSRGAESNDDGDQLTITGDYDIGCSIGYANHLHREERQGMTAPAAPIEIEHHILPIVRYVGTSAGGRTGG